MLLCRSDRRATARWGIVPGLLATLVLGACGCMTQQTRGQKEEEPEHDRYHMATVGEKTTVGGSQPLPISGVGLVVGLAGTGGEAPPDSFRAMLEKELQVERVRNIKEVLRSPNNALVLVSALIPAGARKGDPIDVEVTLPRGSKATSLRGGKLLPCKLMNYDFAENYSDTASGMMKGHTLAHAEGSVLVSAGDQDGEEGQRQGRIWNGARCVTDQPLLLLTNSDQQSGRMTALIAERINETFMPGIRGSDAANSSIAFPREAMAVALRVPAQYRLNIPRFLRVVRLMPLEQRGDSPRKQGQSYQQQLAEDLLDPAHTVTAALRLEALGSSSIPHLKKGLQSSHPLVRFCSAEALLYLGSTAGADEAARAVLDQPLLRAFGLTALASLDEAVCQIKLGEVLVQARDDETRYGAFRALRELDDHNPGVRGELLSESFWLHEAAPNTPPMVHVCTLRRAEIVLFGEQPFLRPPFALMAGEFTVTALEGDTHCMVSHVARGTANRRESSLKLGDVLRTMAELGGMYPEAIELLRQADRSEALTCRVRFDAMPQAVSAEELVKAGKEKIGAGGELVLPAESLGETPTLYDIGKSPEIGWDQKRRPAAREEFTNSSPRGVDE
jgi:hypothetical protein